VIDADTGELLPGTTWAVSPNFYLNRLNLDDKTKTGGTLTFQYRPNDETEVRFDASYSSQEIEHLQTHTRMHNLHRNPYEMTIRLGDGNTSNNVVSGITGHIGGLNQSGRWLNNTDNLVLGAEFDHSIGDDWVISGRVGHSATDQNYTDGFRMNWFPVVGGKQGPASIDNWCGIEYSDGPEGDYLPALNFCEFYGGNDPATMKMTQIRSDRRDVDDSKTSVYFDAVRMLDNGAITSLEFGVKYSDRSKTVRAEEVFFGTSFFENTNTIFASDIPGAATSSITGGHFLSGIANAGMPTDWIYPDIDATIAYVFPNGLSEDLFVPNPLKAWGVDETTYGAYSQANFELLQGDISGNFGLRYVKTEVEGYGHSGFKFAGGLPFLIDGETSVVTPVTDVHDYDNWLPSMTVNWLLSDELVLRGSASRVMARPQINGLRPNFDLKAQNLNEVPAANGGNTSLDPFVANQFDLSLEWYFDEDALLSGAVFYKDFKSFTYQTSTNQQFINPLTGTCIVDRSVYDEGSPERLAATSPCAEINYSQTVNGGTAYIGGFEASYQQHYSSLPGLLSNLGSSINYTYADSEAVVDPDDRDNPFNGLPFLNTSKHSTNTTLYWEDEKLSLRLAHTYRSEALSKTVNRNSATVRDARGTLDFTVNYKITDKLKVSFSALNLTDGYDTFYDVIVNPNGHEADGIVREITGDLSDIPKHRVSSIFNFGRSYRLAFRYSL